MSQPVGVTKSTLHHLTYLRTWLGEPEQVPELHAVTYLMLEQQQKSSDKQLEVCNKRHWTRYVKSASQGTWELDAMG